MQIKATTDSVLYVDDLPTLAETLAAAVKSGANLYVADLRGADLRGAYLRSADLYGADLRGADLYGADLRGADLRGVDLYGADLRGADLRGAKRAEGTISDCGVVALGTPNSWYAIGYVDATTAKIRVEVGCRRFELAEARAYWAGKPDRREVMAALDYLETVINIRREG